MQSRKNVDNMLFLFNKMSNCSINEQVLIYFPAGFPQSMPTKTLLRGLIDEVKSCCYGEQLDGVRTCPLFFR